MSQPTIRELQNKLREDAILDAAQEILSEEGLASLTMDSIVAKVGVSKPTLYRHFASKEDLLYKTVERKLNILREKLVHFREDLPPGAALDEAVELLLNERFRNSRKTTAEMLHKVSLYVHDSIRSAHLHASAELSAIVARAQEAGAARRDIPAVILAQSVTGILKDWHVQHLLETGEVDLQVLKSSLKKLMQAPAV